MSIPHVEKEILTRVKNGVTKNYQNLVSELRKLSNREAEREMENLRSRPIPRAEIPESEQDIFNTHIIKPKDALLISDRHKLSKRMRLKENPLQLKPARDTAEARERKSKLTELSNSARDKRFGGEIARFIDYYLFNKYNPDHPLSPVNWSVESVLITQNRKFAFVVWRWIGSLRPPGDFPYIIESKMDEISKAFARNKNKRLTKFISVPSTEYTLGAKEYNEALHSDTNTSEYEIKNQ